MNFDFPKVVVPEFVVKYIEYCKNSGWYLQKAIFKLGNDEKLAKWAYDENGELIAEKSETFARAWLAYPNITFEKEKLYTVEIPNLTVLEKADDGMVAIRQADVFPVDWKDHAEVQLTRLEIRRNFEWALQWTEEVE